MFPYLFFCTESSWLCYYDSEWSVFNTAIISNSFSIQRYMVEQTRRNISPPKLRDTLSSCCLYKPDWLVLFPCLRSNMLTFLTLTCKHTLCDTTCSPPSWFGHRATCCTVASQIHSAPLLLIRFHCWQPNGWCPDFTRFGALQIPILLGIWPCQYALLLTLSWVISQG